VEENIAAADVELTADDLREMAEVPLQPGWWLFRGQ
jgi:hypothetical protein